MQTFHLFHNKNKIVDPVECECITFWTPLLVFILCIFDLVIVLVVVQMRGWIIFSSYFYCSYAATVNKSVLNVNLNLIINCGPMSTHHKIAIRMGFVLGVGNYPGSIQTSIPMSMVVEIP